MHDHHDHDQTFQPDHDTGVASPYEVLEHAIRELLVEKGVLTNAEISSHIDKMATRNETLGAQVTARAWVDPQFKQRYIEDTRGTLLSLDIDIGDMPSIFAQMGGYSIGTGIFCQMGRSDRIRKCATAGISNGRNMVDVDTKPEIRVLMAHNSNVSNSPGDTATDPDWLCRCSINRRAKRSRRRS